MAKQKYISGIALYDRFLSGFGSYKGLSIIEKCSDILLIELDGHKYYIYLKCVSHKGNPYPLNDQRAQLPQRLIFDKIKKSDIDFIWKIIRVSQALTTALMPFTVLSFLIRPLSWERSLTLTVRIATKIPSSESTLRLRMSTPRSFDIMEVMLLMIPRSSLPVIFRDAR